MFSATSTRQKHDISSIVISYRAFITRLGFCVIPLFRDGATTLLHRRLDVCQPEMVKHQSKPAIDVNAPRSHKETVTRGNLKGNVAPEYHSRNFSQLKHFGPIHTKSDNYKDNTLNYSTAH